MCGYVSNEAGYRSMVREHVSLSKRYPFYMEHARQYLKQAQRRGWLLDYDPITCEPKPVPVPKPKRKPPIHKAGMTKIKSALKEAGKLPAPAKRKETVSA